MTEITLLEAIYLLRIYKNKKERLLFTVTFDDGITRTARFGKAWSKVRKEWTYIVQDGPDSPGFVYGEREAVSAIFRIPGMSLYGATVRYHIHLVDDETK